MYIICVLSEVATVLGFGTFKKVGFTVSISKPRTKALPGEILYNPKSSDALSPAGVN